MFKLVLPILFVGIAGGVFFLYTDPQYQEIKIMRAQEREYDDALSKSKELQSARNALIAKRNTFANDDLRKVERLLPDNVDNIRLILDIDNIAGRYGLRIRGVKVSGGTQGREERSDLAVGSSDDKVGSVELSFTVAATYDDFLRFLRDLERSVRIVDVSKIGFTTGTGDLVEYGFLIKTYWLR
mgnify:CR=1 FL=1